MKKLLILIALTMLASPLLSQEPNPGALTSVMQKIHAWRKATDFKASGRLVNIGASGDRTTYKISIRAKYFPDGIKVYCAITDPAAARVRFLLEPHGGAGPSIHTAHPGDSSAKELPASSMGDALLGTDFLLEDLMDDQFSWKNQTLVEKGACGARQCYVIKSQPAAYDHSPYSAVKSWVDEKSYFPVRVEKVIRSSGAVKTFTNYGLRESKGMWSASQIAAEIRGKPGSSLLIITGGAEKANLPASQFDPAQLTKTD
jgi:hypothetical protein